ncbi:MAG: hypothetical protein ACRDIE_25880, partial [Chloroflexota bacterium]
MVTDMAPDPETTATGAARAEPQTNGDRGAVGDSVPDDGVERTAEPRAKKAEGSPVVRAAEEVVRAEGPAAQAPSTPGIGAVRAWLCT